MRRLTLLRLLPMVLVAAALAALGLWLVPQLRAPQGKTYRFYVEDATGLPVGTEVKFRGLLVGQVTRVELDEARSRERESPWFAVGFQAAPEGEKVLTLWTFRAVTVEKEMPIIGATIVTLTNAETPGGRTPDVLGLETPNTGDLTGDLHDITTGVKQVVTNANDAMLDLKKELEARPEGPFDPLRPTRVAAMLGSLQDAAHQLSVAEDHVSTLTEANGAITVALDKFNAFTADLTNDARPFQATFIDLKKSSMELRNVLARTDRMLEETRPALELAASNTAQMTDTLKREPWRIIWKSSKQYNDASVAPSPSPAAAPAGSRKKRSVSQ